MSHKITTLYTWMQWRKMKMKQNSLKTRHFNFLYDFGAIKRYTCVFFLSFFLHICSNRLVLLFILISNISIPILFFSFCFHFTISFPSFRKYWEYFAFFFCSLHLNFVNKPKRACGSSFLMRNIYTIWRFTTNITKHFDEMSMKELEMRKKIHNEIFFQCDAFFVRNTFMSLVLLKEIYRYGIRISSRITKYIQFLWIYIWTIWFVWCEKS